MLLVDSGGQYDIGTTDVTRTMHLGEPTAWQRECFTRVLKGHIGLATAVFPEGTPHISPISPLHLPYISPTSHHFSPCLPLLRKDAQLTERETSIAVREATLTLTLTLTLTPTLAASVSSYASPEP